MTSTGLTIYFQNAAGLIMEHPEGYAYLRYLPGERKPDDFKALLSHAGRLLERRGWRRTLDDQREMAPLSDMEKAWLTECWNTGRVERPSYLIAAVVPRQEEPRHLKVEQVWNEVPPFVIEYHPFTNEDQARDFLLALAPELSYAKAA